MKFIKKPFYFVVIIALVLTALIPASPAMAAEQNTLKILFTHDMHASLLPAEVINESGTLAESGGFARLYTAIQQERSKDADSTLLVDTGDYSMGTLFQTIETTESPELRLLGDMGYDVVTAGNHEFDYTISGFAKSLRAAKESGDPLPEYVMSNMTLPEGDSAADDLKSAMQQYGVKEYTVIDKDGVKIGLFGLMGEEAAADASTSKPAVFEDIKESSKRIVDILKSVEKVDLIVCLSHSGTNPDIDDSEDEQLAKAVPDIDVIISGHTHTVLSEPIITGHTIIVSCGANSAYLGDLDLTNSGSGWEASGYSLIKIDSSIKDDAAISAKVDEFKAMANDYLGQYGYTYSQVVANSPYQFDNDQYMFDHPADYPLGNLLSDAFIYAVKQAEGDRYVPVDVAVVPMGTIRATINKGDITVADAFKILSLGTGPDGLSGYPLISVYLKGSELENICEVDASVSSMMGDAQLFLSGIKYTYNPHRLIFNKVTDVQLVAEDGSLKQIEPDRLYRVVCGLYSGQMLSYVKSKSFGIISLTPKDKDGNDITDFDRQIIYADRNGVKSEIKEWQAVTEYLSSFSMVDGKSTIPYEYSAAQGRKVLNDSTNIFGLISHLNTFAFIVIGVVIFIIALIVVTIILIRKGISRRRRRKAAAKSS